MCKQTVIRSDTDSKGAGNRSGSMCRRLVTSSCAKTALQSSVPKAESLLYGSIICFDQSDSPDMGSQWFSKKFKS